MPFSNELGMRIYDRNEGVQQGEQAGQIFANSFARAQQNARELNLDERKLKMMDDEVRARATALQQHQLGLDEMKDLVASGVPFEDALFKTAPKVFYNNPAGFVQTVQKQAQQKAAEAAKATAAQALLNYRNAQIEKRTESPEMRRAREKADLELKLKPQTPTEADPAMEAPPIIDPTERDKMILGNLQQEQAFKDAQEARRKSAEVRKEKSLDAATKMEISNIGAQIRTLQKAHDAIESETGAVKEHPNQLKRMRINAQIAGLKEQARVLSGGAATTTAPPENAPGPAKQGEPLKLGTKIKQGGKTYVYQGGDVNDPASYVEEK